MLSPQLLFPKNFMARPGEIGTQVFVIGEGGPQGNPLGTVQPRPYPTTDAAGNPVSFGMSLTPPPYGVANWLARLPFNNRNPEMGLNGVVNGLIKNPSPISSF